MGQVLIPREGSGVGAPEVSGPFPNRSTVAKGQDHTAACTCGLDAHRAGVKLPWGGRAKMASLRGDLRSDPWTVRAGHACGSSSPAHHCSQANKMERDLLAWPVLLNGISDKKKTGQHLAFVDSLSTRPGVPVATLFITIVSIFFFLTLLHPLR